MKRGSPQLTPKSGAPADCGVRVVMISDCGGSEAAYVIEAALDQYLDPTVLNTDVLTQPVNLSFIELLRYGKHCLLRTRSGDGAQANTVPNSDLLANIYPLLRNQVIPV